MKIILVTGSSGLVGSSAVKFFHQKNFKIIGIDNNLREYFFGKNGSTIWVKKENSKLKNFEHYSIDIRNFKAIANIFKKYRSKIKAVIHTAAQPSHDWAKREPITDYTVNANGTLNLLELTRKYSSAAKFIFTSTNKVYGDNPNKIKFRKKKTRFEVLKSSRYYKGISEKMSLDNCVHSFFGVSKTSADLLVQEYGKNLNLKTIIFRAGCITGANHSSAEYHGFLSYLVKKSLKEKSYKVIGYEGKQVRDNIHADDLINCFWQFFAKGKKTGEVYNIGGGRRSNCSVIEALNFVEKYCKIKVKKKFIKQNRTGDHIWYISNNSKFLKDYPNYKFKYNLKKILVELINFYK